MGKAILLKLHAGPPLKDRVLFPEKENGGGEGSWKGKQSKITTANNGYPGESFFLTSLLLGLSSSLQNPLGDPGRFIPISL